MAYVWDNSKQTGSALLMLLAIADHANDDGVCWPSVKRLAARCRVQERQAKKLIKQLEESGELIVERGIGRKHTSLYTIKGAPECTINEAEKVYSSTKKVYSRTPKSAKKVSSSTKKVYSRTPEPSIEPSVKRKPSIEPSTTRGDGDDSFADLQRPAPYPTPAEVTNIFSTLQAAGVFYSAILGEMYEDLAAECGAGLVMDALRIATGKSKQHDFNYVAAIARNRKLGKSAPVRSTNGTANGVETVQFQETPQW